MKQWPEWRGSWTAVIAGLLAFAAPAWAENCVVCREKITGEFVWMNAPAWPEKQAVCRACAKLDTVCATCRLPVKRDFLKLDDGRLLCARHAREAVLTQEDAEALFREAKREMIRLLRGCGATPDQNITLSLVDAQRLAVLSAELQPVAAARFATVGLTRSRRNGGQVTHSIHILSGLGRARFLATSAHEYAHAWMSENVPPDRRLDQNTTEGFCELTAYRLMTDLNEEAEKKHILANAYTRGQIDTFVKAEDSHRFYRIVEWMKSGVGERLEPENTASVLALKPPPPAVLSFPQAAPTPVPETLQLKGISGGPGRWLALVNDLTLGPGEVGRARVGKTNVTIRCVALTDKTAVIELVELGQRQELRLRGQ